MLALAALTLSLHLAQTSYDLLDPVAIQIAVENTAKAPARVTFANPAEYEIVIRHGRDVLWNSRSAPPPGATFPPHVRQFVSGPSVLVVYVWNAIANDGTSPGAGDYLVTARLLGEGTSPSASATLHFIRPVPTAAVGKLKDGDIVTIAGTLDATKGVLTDDTGSIRLARRLPTAPPGPVAVRGYLIARAGGRPQVFFVERWAPMR